jgi:hypothetical protein
MVGVRLARGVRVIVEVAVKLAVRLGVKLGRAVLLASGTPAGRK